MRETPIIPIHNFPTGLHVKITKLGVSAFPKHESAKWEDYTPGQDDDNRLSIPVEYIVDRDNWRFSPVSYLFRGCMFSR